MSGISVKAYNYAHLYEIQDFIDAFTSKFTNIHNYEYGRSKEKDIERLKERFHSWSEEYSHFVHINNNKLPEDLDYEKLLLKMREVFTINIYPYKNEKILENTDEIFAEQKEYLRKMKSADIKSNIWFVIAYYDSSQSVPYGGIFLFRSYRDPDVFIMQGIGFFHAPMLFRMLHPTETLPKLNSLLIPFIIDFIRNLGGKILYVSPYKEQKKILSQIYGFSPSIKKEISTYLDFYLSFGGECLELSIQ